MAKTKALKTTEETALTSYEGYEDEGAGFEDQTSDDNSIPFIEVIQPSSPICAENEEARPGMMRNTVTGELFDGKTGFLAQCVYTIRQVIEWVPRDEGGGYRGSHDIHSEVVRRAKSQDPTNKLGPWKTDDGHDLVETVSAYFVALNEDRIPTGAFTVGFASTQMKPYRAINTMMSTYRHKVDTANGPRYQRPPMWAHCLRFTTEKQKNDKGTWFTFAIRPAQGEISTSLIDPRTDAFGAGKSLWMAVKSGDKYAANERGGNDDLVKDEVPF